MKKLTYALLLGLVVNLNACTALWAQVISNRVADDLCALKSYEGRVRERGVVPGEPETPVIREVVYHFPWRLRAEVLEPKAHAGELFINDGEQMILWSPQNLLGIRIRGFKVPAEREIRRHLQRLTYQGLEGYTYTLEGERKLLGQDATVWKVLPKKKDPYRYPYDTVMHGRYPLPLKLTLFDAPDRPWYRMEFERITFDVPLREDTFAFQFPSNAVVLDWDLTDPGISQEEALRTMNFDVCLPRKLPKHHKIEKIVRGKHSLPMLAVLMSYEATWLSLTENRFVPASQKPLGKTIRIAKGEGTLVFAGSFTVISWVRGKTQLTLVSNMAYTDLIAVAESVEEVKGTESSPGE